ncbi:MAG: hypothetical protein AAGJ87_09390 [Pseudomonadota bacterium]
MDQLLRLNGSAAYDRNARTRLAAGRLRRLRLQEPYEILWWVFAVTVACTTLPDVVGRPPAPVSYVVAICGAAGCGWLWLLTRTLFRAEGALPPGRS